MDVEKRASKGGFLQLFDWNVKSKKKLFSNKSDLPVAEGSKQGKENFANSRIAHPQFMEVCENGPGLRGKSNSDYSFSSLVTHDEEYGTRAPGVVARLMGLDSLPTSTTSEPASTPYCDSPFVRDSCTHRNTSSFRIEQHIITNMPNDRISRSLTESRLNKVQSRPIERFQTESLPPKSAKSIPITHHRLLSPIKSPGFIPTNNVAYIMEAAAKIIEQGPPSTIKGKVMGFGSSSIPLRIQNLKEKMDTAHRTSGDLDVSRRPKELVSFRNNKGERSEKNHSGTGDTLLDSVSVGSVKGTSDNSKNKGKSVSLAVQAKANVQRRGGLTSSGNRSSINRKEGDDSKHGQFIKSQTNVQASAHKKMSRSRSPDVLKQNNLKQNCVTNKDRVVSKSVVSNEQQDRKAPSSSGSVRPSKGSNKVQNLPTRSRNLKPGTKDAGKELMSSKTKTFSEEKQPVHRNVPVEENVAKKTMTNKDERSVNCIAVNDGCLNWDIGERKNSTDVVSFTFTSPIKRSAPGSQSSGHVMEKNIHFSLDSRDGNDPHDSKTSTSSSLGYNVVGGDSLSVLLEQKLKELTCRVESPNCNLVEAGNDTCSAISTQDSLSIINTMNTMSGEYCDTYQLNGQTEKSSHPYDLDCTSVDALRLKAKQKWQGLEEMEGLSSSSNNSEYGKELDCRYPSPISNLEPSSSDGSYYSSDSKTSSITTGLEQYLLAEANVMVDGVFGRKRPPVEVELELSDSASSASATCVNRNDIMKSSKWELEYITKTLCNSGLTFEDFVLGQVNKAMTSDLFDRLENPKTDCDKKAEEYFKLNRKFVFDSVNECLVFRSEQLSGGSCRAWSKWATLFQRKGWLAEELYEEISSWTSMGDLMMDELVDKDMSTRHGRWVDFDIEAREEGVEIEKGILTSLVDELVADFFFI